MLYVFEGPDSVGKSTISAGLAAKLRQTSHAPVRHWSFPGREPGTLGWAVYQLHHTSSSLGVESLTPTSLQMLHIAAHVDAIESRILPALAAGDIVILDRFWWSTWVYGVVSCADSQALSAMIDVEMNAWRGVQPDVAFLIDRDEPFALRSDEQLDRWHQLRAEYSRISHQQQTAHRIARIINTGTMEDSISRVANIATTTRN